MLPAWIAPPRAAAGAEGLAEAWHRRRVDAITLDHSERARRSRKCCERVRDAALPRRPLQFRIPRIAEARARAEAGARHRRPAHRFADLIASSQYYDAVPDDLQCAADVLITAPLPPFSTIPLKAYRCHDYRGGGTTTALLAAEGAAIRELVQGRTATAIKLLDALPELEIISVFGVGYDGVPTAYCRQRGIKVTNTPDVLTDDGLQRRARHWC